MQKRKSAGTSIEVLIDTWWNVNVFFDLLLDSEGEVLIDTWWNVNVGAAGLCYVPDVVLIDTWWNVNWTLE